MPIPFKAAIDLEKNELQNARVQNLSSDPGTPVEGQLYYNSTTKVLGFRTNTSWVYLGRLDQITAPTADVSMGGFKVTNVATPTAGTDAATKDYVDGLAQGLDAKPSCRAATTANITLSGAQTIDGVSVVTGDRVLVKDQSTPSQNGIYVAAAGAWSRAADMDAWTEVPGAFVFVEEGTANADSGWICSANAGGTLGSTAITWVQFSQAGVILAGTGLTKSGVTISMANMAALSVKGNATNASAAPADIAAGTDHQVLRRSGTTLGFGALNLAQAAAVTGSLPIANGGHGGTSAATARVNLAAPRYYVANVGATSSGAVTVTHGMGTRDVQVQVVRIAAPYETIYCDVERTDTNTVTLRFGADYAIDTFRCIVIGVGV